MKVSGISRYVLCASMSIALLAGCGGSQPPIGALGAMQQTSAIATYAERGGSWMEPTASSNELLYIAAWPPAVYVYTYPKGQLVGTLTGSAQLFGECTDSAGDVFIVAYSNGSVTSSTIYEYAHGGTSPIATLNDPKTAQGCAVDPQTGNLAASGDGVAIFKNASGNPKMYYSSEYGFYYCSYDNKSNLYLTAANGSTVKAILVRLASGSASFEQISLIPKLYVAGNIAPTVQWDGRHITVTSDQERRPISLYRLRITGSSATVISSATLNSPKNVYYGQMWIQEKTIIGVGYGHHDSDAFLWPYPKGGVPYRTIKEVGETRFPMVSAVTVSVGQPQ